MSVPHGWFEIPGVQTGERSLADQVVGLDRVLAEARGATVLDVACAEGMIGGWLIDKGGAALVDGLDGHAPYLDTARKVFADQENMSFELVDLNRFVEWREERQHLLIPRYDIVLALNILQKLADPEGMLRELAGLCSNLLAISLPADVIHDRRSDFKTVDPVEVLADDFDRIRVTDGMHHPVKGFYGRRMVFRRRA